MRVFVIAGSPLAQPPCCFAPGPADRVIAADFGAHHARAWGWPIDLLIDDLDSLPLTHPPHNYRPRPPAARSGASGSAILVSSSCSSASSRCRPNAYVPFKHRS